MSKTVARRQRKPAPLRAYHLKLQGHSATITQCADITNPSEFRSSSSVGARGGEILLGCSECPDVENVHSCEADGGVQRLTVRSRSEARLPDRLFTAGGSGGQRPREQRWAYAPSTVCGFGDGQ